MQKKNFPWRIIVAVIVFSSVPLIISLVRESNSGKQIKKTQAIAPKEKKEKPLELKNMYAGYLLEHAGKYNIKDFDSMIVAANQRFRGSANITGEASDMSGWAETTVRAAIELQKKHNCDAVHVLYFGPCNDFDYPCARVVYAPDGKGWTGDDFGNYLECDAWSQEQGGKQIPYPVFQE